MSKKRSSARRASSPAPTAESPAKAEIIPAKEITAAADLATRGENLIDTIPKLESLVTQTKQTTEHTSNRYKLEGSEFQSRRRIATQTKRRKGGKAL